MQNWRLDDILSSQSNNMRLVEGLKLLKQWATLGSLASSDDLEFAELCQFRQIYLLEIEDTITGSAGVGQCPTEFLMSWTSRTGHILDMS